MRKSFCLALFFAAAPALSVAQQPAQTEPSAAMVDATVTPDWKVRPDVARHYPKRALEKEITGGAVIECHATPKGKLTSCVALAETPEGYGFGKAGVAAARTARVTVTNGDKESQGENASGPGRKIRFRLIWTVK